MSQERRVRSFGDSHKAFTTVAKAMPMSTRLPAIQAVSKLSGLTTEVRGTA